MSGKGRHDEFPRGAKVQRKNSREATTERSSGLQPGDPEILKNNVARHACLPAVARRPRRFATGGFEHDADGQWSDRSWCGKSKACPRDRLYSLQLAISRPPRLAPSQKGLSPRLAFVLVFCASLWNAPIAK